MSGYVGLPGNPNHLELVVIPSKAELFDPLQDDHTNSTSLTIRSLFQRHCPGLSLLQPTSYLFLLEEIRSQFHALPTLNWIYKSFSEAGDDDLSWILLGFDRP